MARKGLNKPIVELDKPNGKVKKFWLSAKAAADFYGFTQQVIISYNVNGITKQAKGHYFRFATKKEIADYEAIINKADEPLSAETSAVATEFNETTAPVETIPEVVQKPDDQDNTLSPFDRLLQAGKKKFNENSD